MKHEDLLKNISEFVSKRKQEKPRVANYLAATVKNARIQRRMTLAQAVNNICSQSSWSKFENNYLNLPPEIIQSVCERMDLNYREIVNLNHLNNLPDCMEHYLFNHYKEIQEMYDFANNEMFLSRDALIKCIYYLAFKRFDELLETIKTLDNVKNTLSDYELIMLIFCTIEYYIQINHFLEAQKYLKIIELIPTNDIALNTLHQRQKFIIACHLRDYYILNKSYQKLSVMSSRMYPILNRYLDRIMYLEAYPSDESLEDLGKLEFEEYFSDYKNEIYYTRMLILIDLGRFHEVIKLIIENQWNEIRFACLLGYAIARISNENRNIEGLDSYYQKFYELFNNTHYSEMDNVHVEFIKYIKLVLDENTDIDNELNYLRNNLIPKLDIIQHRLYTFVYASRYTYLLGKRSKYKESHLFTYHNHHLLNDLHLQEF